MPDKINEAAKVFANNFIGHLKDGTVKRPTLPNDGPEYSFKRDADETKQYEDFLGSEIWNTAKSNF